MNSTQSPVGQTVRVRRRTFDTATGRTINRFTYDGILTREGHGCIFVDEKCVSTDTHVMPSGATMETSWEVLEAPGA